MDTDIPQYRQASDATSRARAKVAAAACRQLLGSLI
jgi:hypothetical protein